MTDGFFSSLTPQLNSSKKRFLCALSRDNTADSFKTSQPDTQKNNQWDEDPPYFDDIIVEEGGERSYRGEVQIDREKKIKGSEEVQKIEEFNYFESWNEEAPYFDEIYVDMEEESYEELHLKDKAGGNILNENLVNDNVFED